MKTFHNRFRISQKDLKRKFHYRSKHVQCNISADEDISCIRPEDFLNVEVNDVEVNDVEVNDVEVTIKRKPLTNIRTSTR